MIRIVDYGMGNLRSVQKALEKVGAAAEVTSDPDLVRLADRLVVPGVGAFPDAMANLHAAGLDAAIVEFARSGRPILGICLGLQLFFESSDEYGDHAGLGLFPGRVTRFETAGGRKVPHMGWNTLRIRQALFKPFDGEYVYFVHSYRALASDERHVAAETDYGGWFCAAAVRDNVWAFQFHPEKSGACGLRLLQCFVGRT